LAAVLCWLRRRRGDAATEVAVLVTFVTVASVWVPHHYLTPFILTYFYLAREFFAGRLGRAATALAAASLIIIMWRYDIRPYASAPWPWPLLVTIKPLAIMSAAAAVFLAVRRGGAPPPELSQA